MTATTEGGRRGEQDRLVARRITRPTGRPVRMTHPTGGGGSAHGGYVAAHTAHGFTYARRKA